jgi:hypothetical protein
MDGWMNECSLGSWESVPLKQLLLPLLGERQTWQTYVLRENEREGEKYRDERRWLSLGEEEMEGEALLCSKFRGEGEGSCVYGGQLGAGFDAVQWMLPS